MRLKKISNQVKSIDFIYPLLPVIVIGLFGSYIVKLNNKLNANRTALEYANEVIKVMEEDNPDYFYDVMVETDIYNNYIQQITKMQKNHDN